MSREWVFAELSESVLWKFPEHFRDNAAEKLNIRKGHICTKEEGSSFWLVSPLALLKALRLWEVANPHCIWIRHLLNSRQAFPHLQSILIYSINNGIQVKVHAALVGAVAVCRAECQPLLILVSLGFFFSLNWCFSRRGILKSAAHPGWGAAHTAGVWLCLVSLVFTCISCGHFILGWAPTLHGSFVCSAQSVAWWSMGVRWSVGVRTEGWGWGRCVLQSDQAVPTGLSTPILCHSGDSECLVFLHQHCRKVGMLWWAIS